MLTVGCKVKVSKGCRARDISKGAVAVVKAIEPLGPDYSHAVRVNLMFLNTFLSGKTVSLYARHQNRLADAAINLNDGRPEHSVQIVIHAKPVATANQQQNS